MAPDQPPSFANLGAQVPMPFRWQMHDEDGDAFVPHDYALQGEGFETQADAESWLGEMFPDLLEEGIESVTLFKDDELIYGPMSLRP
ncbi:hypothetical protein NODU109028_06185 [Nocardioides dubius]|uniref:Uncharacterized protein n=1 Tax=Nocardioides dubius TaxID=317019 RepID=A0ABN1U449_9ACTN